METMAGRAEQLPPAGRPTFLQAMVEVWRRPSLTGIEIAWRWSVSAISVVFYVPLYIFIGLGYDQAVRSGTVSGITLFKPVDALAQLQVLCGFIWASVGDMARWMIPLLFLIWGIGAAIGRAVWLKRYDSALKMRRPTFALLTLLKLSKLVAMLGTWVGCWALALRVAVVGPAARHDEPNMVLFAAMMIGLTLLLFIAWSVSSWILQLAPLIAMQRDVSVRKGIVMAIRAPKKLRSGLIETNLVMGITKVALLVLAMVFSACPLPFMSVETQGFLTCWWVGVGMWWLVASDYFHVVRIVAVLRLLKANDFSSKETASGVPDAS